jgi:pimeloyl-ACP methyl ester carboxylesterase
MRGYNLSSVPTQVSDYHVEKLASDIALLIEELGEERAHLVGHDWGALVAWFTAMWYPERLITLSILNVPHPRKALRNFWRPSQLLKSWYVLFFQLPYLPERLMSAWNFSGLRLVFRSGTRRKDAFTESDIQHYIEALRRPGVITGSINYYRSLIRNIFSIRKKLVPILTQTLVLWGRYDYFLGRFLAEPYPEDVPNQRVEYIEGSHWVQVDAFDKVNHLLIEFFHNSQR